MATTQSVPLLNTSSAEQAALYDLNDSILSALQLSGARSIEPVLLDANSYREAGPYPSIGVTNSFLSYYKNETMPDSSPSDAMISISHFRTTEERPFIIFPVITAELSTESPCSVVSLFSRGTPGRTDNLFAASSGVDALVPGLIAISDPSVLRSWSGIGYKMVFDTNVQMTDFLSSVEVFIFDDNVPVVKNETISPYARALRALFNYSLLKDYTEADAVLVESYFPEVHISRLLDVSYLDNALRQRLLPVNRFFNLVDQPPRYPFSMPAFFSDIIKPICSHYIPERRHWYDCDIKVAEAVFKAAENPMVVEQLNVLMSSMSIDPEHFYLLKTLGPTWCSHGQQSISRLSVIDTVVLLMYASMDVPESLRSQFISSIDSNHNATVLSRAFVDYILQSTGSGNLAYRKLGTGQKLTICRLLLKFAKHFMISLSGMTHSGVDVRVLGAALRLHRADFVPVYPFANMQSSLFNTEFNLGPDDDVLIHHCMTSAWDALSPLEKGCLAYLFTYADVVPDNTIPDIAHEDLTALMVISYSTLPYPDEDFPQVPAFDELSIFSANNLLNVTSIQLGEITAYSRDSTIV